MTLDEQLSRLHSGDLSPDESEALRARIANEPEVARTWAELQDMLSVLGTLPEEAEPPPLSWSNPAQDAPRRRVHPAIPWAVAVAALLFAFLRGPPAPQIEIVKGEQVLAGQLQLVAGGHPIALDGRARILVEPSEEDVRVGLRDPEEDPMDKRPVVAAIAGAILTITVYEGTAIVRADGTDPVPVTAGQERTFGSTVAPRRAPAPGTPERARELRSRLDALDAELEATRKELETEKFAGALVRGQLQAEQGQPSLWDEAPETPEAMTPERFEDELTKQFEGMEGYEIAEVDCSEYPCIGAVRYTGEDAADWDSRLGEKVGSWTEATLGEDHSLSHNTSRWRNDDHEARFVFFGAHTADRESGVNDRTKWRIDEMVEATGDQIAQEAESLEGQPEP